MSLAASREHASAAYMPIPTAEGRAPPREDILRLLSDLAGRKEFRPLGANPGGANPGAEGPDWGGFVEANPGGLFLPGLRLNGAQLFIRNFSNPDTDYPRVLIKWQTGVGKSIAAISISQEFVRQFRLRASSGVRAPTVYVISFTARETIQEDMLKFPEFGFVSAAEVEELKRLRAAAGAAGPLSEEAKQLSGHVGALRRRVTDRARGGFFQFYGYKEFANRLFVITRQGQARGFDVQALYSRSEDSFGERLAEAVRRGDVVVNEELLDEMRGGLLVADEIHNVYNILEKNNYGIAIQYVLDALGDDAPRAVFMSATPVTGSAAEIVDLLNLLVPRRSLPGRVPLRRAEFFSRSASAAEAGRSADEDPEESHFVVSALKEGAIDKIAQLSAGRVSFLLDSDVGSYPRREFVGDDVPGVPYLRLTLCPMSRFHSETLAREQAAKEAGAPSRGLPANAYTLYDMAFPNPEFPPDAAEDPAEAGRAFGLYRSGETPSALSQASPEWRAAAGVVVEKGSDMGLTSGTLLMSGPFLGRARLPAYSAKFAKILEATVEALRAGPGKIMIYHHRVRMSGVLLLQEMLRMNGFADEESSATDSTLCSVCGAARGAHGEARGPQHVFAPARFVVAHSDVDRAAMVRSIARFNAPTNAEGHQFRVIIGSKVVREGLNFRGVRHQFVASLPTDFPTLLQVFGRVVRKDSHADLPHAERDVRIRVFVSAWAGERVSPELQRYIDKGREYLVIQQVERALHEFAVDGFANYGRIRAALAPGTDGPRGPMAATIDALPYEPAVGPAAAPREPATATFLAYGHGEREVATVAAVCRVLFRARPVWKREDLWEAVRSGAVRGAAVEGVSEGSFALALLALRRPFGSPPVAVARAGDFFVLARARADASARVDFECYLRDAPPPEKTVVRIADFVRAEQSEGNWLIRLREFDRRFLVDPEVPAELSLVEFGAEFHYELLRRLTMADAPVTSGDATMRSIYVRFRIAITAAEGSRAKAFRGARTKRADEIVGYVTDSAVSLYDSRAAQWYNAPLAEFGIERRHRENDILVGFVSSGGAEFRAKFKVRPPMHKLSSNRAEGKRQDVRGLARGAVCETRPREELADSARRLRAAVIRLGIEPATGGAPADAEEHLWSASGTTPPGSDFAASAAAEEVSRGLSRGLRYAMRFDAAAQRRFPSAGELCNTIKAHLLALEEEARSRASGMASGTRWLYLFNDRVPTISSLAAA
jgi:hypothetical protein